MELVDGDKFHCHGKRVVRRIEARNGWCVVGVCDVTNGSSDSAYYSLGPKNKIYFENGLGFWKRVKKSSWEGKV